MRQREGSGFLVEKKIWLYGDNTFSRNSFRKLRSSGYEVLGIIDQRAYEMTLENEITYVGINRVPQDEVKNTVCIVCLNNGLEHDNVAESLSQAGFQYILYIPMHMNGSIEEQRVVRNSYADFSDGYYERVCIPAYNRKRNPFVIINKSEDAVSFWCPKKILRTGTNEQYRRAAEVRNLRHSDDLLRYADVELDAFRPYITLFQSLAENKRMDGAEEYLRIQRNSEEERSRLFQDRKVLFGVFEERFRYDMTFFLDSPAKTIWNKKGWLTIVDGLHRIYYLNYKGYDFYPVSVKKDEYDLCTSYYKAIEKKESGNMANRANAVFSRGGGGKLHRFRES